LSGEGKGERGEGEWPYLSHLAWSREGVDLNSIHQEGERKMGKGKKEGGGK